MKSLFLLVLLSQNGAGDINAAFVNTESLAQCQQKQLLIKGIFSSAGIPILESRCIQSELRFSTFQHGESSRDPGQFYLIRFDEQAVAIEPMPDWRNCMAKQKAAPEQGHHYCSSTLQLQKIVPFLVIGRVTLLQTHTIAI